MTDGAPQKYLDPADAERRGRRREPLVVLGMVALATGWAGASEQLLGLTGVGKWIAVGGYVLFFVCLLAAQRLSPRLRSRARDGYRLEYALREHADPGPEVREKVDRMAAYMTRIAWFRWWWVFLIPAGALIGAPWDRAAVTVPSAVLLVAGVTAWALYLRRFYADARRWVTDPPGPPREMPPPRRWERWLTGWAFLWVLLGFVAVTTAATIAVHVLAN